MNSRGPPTGSADCRNGDIFPFAKKNNEKQNLYSHAHVSTRRETWTLGNQPNTFQMGQRVDSHFVKKIKKKYFFQ